MEDTIEQMCSDAYSITLSVLYFVYLVETRTLIYIIHKLKTVIA